MDDLQKKRIDRAIKEIYEHFKNPVPVGAPAYDEYWQDLIDVTDALAFLVHKKYPDMVDYVAERIVALLSYVEERTKEIS